MLLTEFIGVHLQRARTDLTHARQQAIVEVRCGFNLPRVRHVTGITSIESDQDGTGAGITFASNVERSGGAKTRHYGEHGYQKGDKDLKTHGMT